MKVEFININDIESVSDLCRKCILNINAKDLIQSQVNILLDEFSVKGLTDYSKKNRVYVVKAEDKIIGTGTLANNQIKGVFVDIDHQGKGIGKFLMNFLELELKENGIQKAELTSSKYAKNFYLKLDYKEAGIINSGVGELIMMEKTI